MPNLMMRYLEVKFRDAGGSWVNGWILDQGYPVPGMGAWRFEALVFPEPPIVSEYQIGTTGISKLHIQQRETVVFHWEREEVVATEKVEVDEIVKFIGENARKWAFPGQF